jgi:hypothetical protein
MGSHGSGHLIAIVRDITRAGKEPDRDLRTATRRGRQNRLPDNNNLAPARAFQFVQLILMGGIFVVLAMLIYVIAIGQRLP